MYCESCGSFIPDGDAFCTKCGTPVSVTKTAAVPTPAPVPTPVPTPAPTPAPVAAPAGTAVPPVNAQPTDKDGYTYSTMVVGKEVENYKEPVKSSTLSAFGLGFGMVAIMMCWLPGINFAMAITALVIGIIVIAKRMQGRAFAIASITCASLSITFGLLELIRFM